MFSIFSTAQKLPKIFTEFFGKCKNFPKKIRKNKRKTFQSPIWKTLEIWTEIKDKDKRWELIMSLIHGEKETGHLSVQYQIT